MGFLDDLFLGEGPKLETRSLPTISPEQRNALNALLSSLGQPSTPYTGQMSAGLSDLENASLGALEERSRALALPDKNLEAAGASIRDQLDFRKNTGDANDYFTNAVQNPALKAFSSDVLPAISRNFGGGSFFSTERQNTEGSARRDLLDSLTAQRSKVNLDQFNAARDRALQAAGIVPSLTGAENSRTQSQMDILKAAGVKREVEQDALDRNYAEFVRQQQDEARRQGLTGQLSTTPTIENIGMTDPGNAGLIPSLLGAIAAGAGGQLGQGLGGLLSNGIGRLFGNHGTDSAVGGGASSDPAGSAAAGAAGAGAAGAVGAAGAGSAIPGAVGSAGAATPGGAVTITDMAGNVLPSVPFAGGAGLEALIGGLQPGIASGIAGTEAANLAALGSLPMPTLGGGGAAAGGALGGGASADAAGALAGGTTGLGLAAGLGIAGLPALIMALGGLGNNRTERNALALQQSGLQQTQLAGGTRVLLTPNGDKIPFNDSLMDDIRERWGVLPTNEFWAWINTLPRVQGDVRRFVQPGGPNAPRRTPGRAED